MTKKSETLWVQKEAYKIKTIRFLFRINVEDIKLQLNEEGKKTR